ncbi:IS607 family transposase [Streptomyces sp. NPDC059378]|uniref:IS607 family transposase n=1 Tax=Streptomyces sp. NPDC059378 TaxID=3346815 RepID=UPI0036CE6244
MKLSEWVRQRGVSCQTAWWWVKAGKMPVPVCQALSGTWLVDEVAVQVPGRVVACCRVSSAGRKADLDRQVARLVLGANGLGLAVTEVIAEVGSGLDRRRRKLHRVLSDPRTAVIVVESRDRLARFGVEYLDAVLSASGRRLVVVDPAETTDDLVRDSTEMPVSMCARLHGRRTAKSRAARAVAVVTGEVAG